MFLAGRDFRTRKLGAGKFDYYVTSLGQFGVRADRLRRSFEKASRGSRSSEFGVGKTSGIRRSSFVRGRKEKDWVSHEREGLRKVSWPGRLEVLSERPWIVLDGAHNPGAMKTIAEILPETFSYRKLFLIFGMMKDKNIRQTLNYVTPLSSRILLTRAEYDRSADPEDLKGFFQGRKPPPRVFPTIPQAINQARKEAGPEDLILITGSLFVAGEARAWWEKKKSKNITLG
ncbi:MAG: hypothetical protein HY787_01525 [Deltaproteobacteria bacterium]|nr:hypothetical protein [Deltaproteobacteria bacterium]